MAFELSKLYILILLSLALVQTIARRAQMLPLPNTTTNTTIPSSNDTKPLITDNNSIITSTPKHTNDIKPMSLSSPKTTKDLPKNSPLSPQYFAFSSNYSQEAAKTNDKEFFTPDVQNATSSPPENFVSSPKPQEASIGNDDEFLTQDVQNDTASSPVIQNSKAPPPSQALGDQNDVVFSSHAFPPPPLETDDSQDDMSFYTPPAAPVLAPAATTFDDFISPSKDSSDYENFPKFPPEAPVVVEDDGDYSLNLNPAPPVEVLLSTYEADVEVDPELAEEIRAYTESQEDDRQSRTAVVVAGAICLIGVGGVLYKKSKNDALKKSQYQYLSKRDVDN